MHIVPCCGAFLFAKKQENPIALVQINRERDENIAFWE